MERKLKMGGRVRYGNCDGLGGDCSGIYGDCTGTRGNLDECNISDEERKAGINIKDLVMED